MAGMKFEYDESGAKFFYFLLSFYLMVLIPCTYYFWPKKTKKSSPHPEDLSCFEPARIKYQNLNKNEPRKRVAQTITKLAIIFAWILLVYLAYMASQIKIEDHKDYDPYAILNIDRGASMQEIKKQYRELSKVMHPDKGGDADKFKEIAKAYQALTDEEMRKNWEEYGNPDGPGVTNFGIALPKWIVDQKNSYLVLGVYVLIFMILMPTIVGIWWYKSIKYTSDQVLMKTSQMYFIMIIKSPTIIIKRAIMILGSSFEFEKSSNSEVIERPSDNIEVPQLMKELTDLQEKIREPPFSYIYSIKARALIHAHLSRLNLPQNTLEKDKNVIIKKCPFLINEMVNAVSAVLASASSNALPRGFHLPGIDTLENIMRLSPMIVQALWDKNKKNSLLQLPHLEENHLRHFMTKKRNICTIKQFVATKDSERRSILRHLTDEQYDDIIRVCSTYPHVEMDLCTKVFDDEDDQTITVGALVTILVTLSRCDLKMFFDREDSITTSNKVEQNNESENEELNDTNLTENKEEEQPKSSNKQKHWEKQKKKSKNAKTKNKKAKTKAKGVLKQDDSLDNKIASAEDEGEESQDENTDENTSNDEAKEAEDFEKDQEKNRSKISPTNVLRKRKTDNDEFVETVCSNKDAINENNNAKSEEYFEKFQQLQKKREKLETKAKSSHRVYCPFFPEVKQECWWLYVADRKNHSIITAPIYICSLKDTEEFEIKFVAPKNPGTYTYSIILRSDSYLDFDVTQNMKLEVMPAKKIEEHPQWNFSDDEEAKEGILDDNDDEYNTESEDDDN